MKNNFADNYNFFQETDNKKSCKSKIILVTGGAGFIGSNFVRFILDKYPEYRVINFDKLTYAGNLNNLSDVVNRDNYACNACFI